MTIDTARLKELLDKATARPWTNDIQSEYGDLAAKISTYSRGVWSAERQAWVVKFDDDYGTDQWADADLIVAAVNALPDLIAEVERLQDVRHVTDEEWDRIAGHSRLIAERDAALARVKQLESALKESHLRADLIERRYERLRPQQESQ